MKKYLVLATSALVLAGCSSDDFVGDSNGNVKNSNVAINFSSETGAITRAGKSSSGQDAATALDNNFVVVGIKNAGTNGWENDNSTLVFDNYNVNYVNETAISTPSNTNGWEYVGQSMGVKGNTNTEGTGNAPLAQTAKEQNIKYWDRSASNYYFYAFSMGKGKPDTSDTSTKTYAKPTSNPKVAFLNNGEAYSFTGDIQQLGECYYTDFQKVEKGNYGKPVQLQFRHVTSKMRIGFFETISGYVVSDMTFYTNQNSTDGILNGKFYTSGTVTVKGGTDGNATTTTSYTTQAATMMNFGKVDYHNEAEGQIEEGNKYLSQSASNPSYCGNGYLNVIPNVEFEANLKIDYTLTATDGSGEQIKLKGVTVVIPKEYLKFLSNYAYTFIFRISENTNGSTSDETDDKGLTAISFDAVVLDETTGEQTTITTVANPSITTVGYKDNTCVTGDEYPAGTNIYATVHLPKEQKNYMYTTEGAEESTQGTATWKEEDLAPQKLYTVTIDNGAAQTINEASVANAIAKGTQSTDNNNITTYTVTDANGKKMVVTETAKNFATEVTSIPTPDGGTKTLKALKWTAAADAIYVVEYTESRQITENGTTVNHPNYDKKSYKIVRTK